MPAKFSKLTLTNDGRELMAKVIAESDTIRFTKLAVSSAVYEEDELPDLTALDDIKQNASITSIVRTSEETVQLEIILTDETVKEDYYIHTIGLYAAGNDDTEILYAAAVETSGTYIMFAYNGVTVSGIDLTLVVTVGNALNVSLETGLFANVPSVYYEASTETLVFTFDNSSSGGSGGGGSEYVLPVATSTRLGGIKIGSGLTIDSDGTTSVNFSELAKDAETAAEVVEAGTEEMTQEEVNDAYNEASE